MLSPPPNLIPLRKSLRRQRRRRRNRCHPLPNHPQPILRQHPRQQTRLFPLPFNSVISQQWSSLSILSPLTSDTNLLAKDAWERDDEGSEEEDAHDDKGKDPLESDGLAEELADAEGGGEDGEGEAHGVVLEGNEEEKTIDQDTPDRNVCKDACSQSLSMERNSSIPVDGHKSPSKRSTDDWEVNEAWCLWVAEVERGQVAEVDDQDDLGPDKVRADEEHDECELEKVVKDEVRTDGGGGLDIGGVGGEEVPDVADLEEEEDDPVDGRNDRVQLKGCMPTLVLPPDGVVWVFAIVWGVEGVVDAGCDSEEPGDDGEDLVGPDGFGIVGIAAGKGVDAVESVHVCGG